MTDDELPLAAGILAGIAAGELSERPGLAGPRTQASARARDQDGAAERAATASIARLSPTYRAGAAFDTLRRNLAALRRRADPAVQAVAEQLADEAVEALLALAARAEEADPVARIRKEKEAAAAERLRKQLDRATALRAARRAGTG